MLTDKQIEKIVHMTGLSRKRIPFRNYYNSGRSKDKALDDLVDKGIMRVRLCSYAGYYYHLTMLGFEFIYKNQLTFNYDKRFKSAQSLYFKAML